MSIDTVEMSRLMNNAPPPADFKLQGAWEIRERVPKNITRVRPLKTPKTDNVTEYEVRPGEARYLVEQDPNVGVGGMADVYKAWDKRLGQYVAIKKINNNLLGHPDYIENIELEAKTMARIRHPGIPVIYDFNIVQRPDGEYEPVFIMELIKALDLRNRLEDQSKPPLTITEVSEIITQVADTVDFMNEKKLTHKDISPRNILLSKPHVKIVDFDSSTWVEKNTISVSEQYSPKEAYYKKRADIRTDEFSLAATAYQAFFGVLPIIKVGIVDLENMRQVIINPEQSTRILSNNNRKKLVEIFQKAFAEKPDDRYQTASEFAKEFCEIITNPIT